MTFSQLTALAGLAVFLAPLTAHAQAPASSVPLRYKFTVGQKIRYLIMRDPYFLDPAGAVEAADPRAPYRPPSVKRLMEEVQSVRPNGTATIAVTVSPEPGFEDDDHPVPPVVQTVTVTPLGEVDSPLPHSPLAAFLRVFFRLPAPSVLRLADVRGGNRGLAVITQSLPPVIAQSTSPDHDGTLLQTTRSAQSDRIIFDLGAGNLLRQTSSLTVAVSLTMTNRGRRGAADFGHVVPSLQVVQTLTIERKEDVLPASASLPSPALAARQSKN